MTRDYVVSFIAEGVAVILALAVYRIAASQWPQETFAEYALSRKILSAILVIALLGMDTALIRYVAVEAGGRAGAAASYLLTALGVVALASGALLAAAALFRDPLGEVLYGEPGHASLMLPMGLLSFGGALYGVAYAHERAHLRIGHAAVLLVLVTGLVPLLAIVAFPAAAADALTATGWGWVAVGGGAIAMRVRPAARAPAGPLLAYGAPRAGGLLLQMGLLAVPGVIAAHAFGIVEGGNVAFALLVLGLLSTLLTPIGVVLMPRSAHMLRERASAELRRHVRHLVALVLPLTAALVVAVELVAEPLVTAYLGPDYAIAAPTLRAIAWAAIPWSMFVTLRGLLDAYDLRPLNARNVLVACVAYAAGIAVAGTAGLGAAWYHGAFVGAAIVLGGLTIFEAERAMTRPVLPQPVIEDALQP